MSSNHYKYVVIGGGINGIGITRDLALHEQQTLIIDKGSWATQTSSRSSKMLHGGIRYLEHLDFSLIKEALSEKNIWLKLCPDFCHEEKFFIPVYKNSAHRMLELQIGLKIYDALSKFKNKASHRHSVQETLKFFPKLNSENLLGSVSYYDAIVDDEALAKACLYDAVRTPYATAWKNSELISASQNKYGYSLIVLKEGKEISVQCQYLIFATGPFTDQVLKKLKIPWTPHIVLSKGSHIHIKKECFPLEHALVIQEKNRIIFLIPNKHYHLLGTTEIALPPNSEIYNIEIIPEEIEYLKKAFYQYFSQYKITDNDIVRYQAGVRPLVSLKNSEDSPGELSRFHHVFSPLENCYVLIGGKYTTFRKMASDLVSTIFSKEGISYNPNKTLQKLEI
ncbi:MAG: FAD-dependent oxidoreductase [Halobacteriovoraceae bacterium]|nr:FAD-dependent oxidoreductase [Halobacteriovoraceae bacterium]